MNDRDAHDELPELDELDQADLAMLAAFQAEERPPASSVARVRERVLASTTAPPAATVIRGPWVAAVAVVAAAAAALLLIDFGGDDATAVSQHGVQQAVDTPETVAAERAISRPRDVDPAPRPQPSPDPVAPIEAPPKAAAPPEPPPPARRPAAANKRTAAPPEPAPEPVSSLAAETRLLDRARKAVADGRPDEALTILREAQSRFPQGVLGQERAALRVVALCDAGRLDAGRDAAASFVKAHPRSALRARVESACPAK